MTDSAQGWSRRLPATSVRPLSQQRRQVQQLQQAGLYTPASLWQFRQLWHHSGRPADLLAYLKFRRALGYPLSTLRCRQLSQLLTQSWLQRWRQGITPAIARALHRLLQEGQQQQPAQPAWLRQQFSQQEPLQHQWLQRCRAARRIAIVGNGPHLQHSAAGPLIDSADLVLRFNHCFSGQTCPADTGSKTDIWVVAPGFRGPQVQSSLVILSGPAMLWQLQQLHYLQQLACPLLQMPLSCWQTLVRRFGAPPSAAPLVTHWLLSQGIRPAQLHLFGVGQPAEQRYHHALPGHQASSRHHWQAEHQWWQQLIDGGAQG